MDNTRQRCAEIECPNCGELVDPYRPLNESTRRHAVENITRHQDSVERFIVRECKPKERSNMRLAKVTLRYEATSPNEAGAVREITISADEISFPDSKPYPREVRVADAVFKALRDRHPDTSIASALIE